MDPYLKQLLQMGSSMPPVFNGGSQAAPIIGTLPPTYEGGSKVPPVDPVVEKKAPPVWTPIIRPPAVQPAGIRPGMAHPWQGLGNRGIAGAPYNAHTALLSGMNQMMMGRRRD